MEIHEGESMSKIKFDVVVGRNYKGAGGDERVSWTNIGRVIANKDGQGFSLKIDAVPVGWDGWASLFEPKPKEAGNKPPAQERDPDEIPF